jgi:hypothetical protein
MNRTLQISASFPYTQRPDKDEGVDEGEKRARVRRKVSRAATVISRKSIHREIPEDYEAIPRQTIAE